MKFPIGAMSVGDILDRGLRVLLARLPTFYLINFIVAIPVFALQVAAPVIASSTPNAALGVLVSVPVILLLTLILAPIGTAASLHIIAQEFVDRRVSLGDALSFALRRFGPLLITSILAGLVIGLGFLLLVIPGIIFSIWYLFVGQVVVVEGLDGSRALARSKELTAGFRWRIFGIVILFTIIGGILQVMVGGLNYVLPAGEAVMTPSGPRIIKNVSNEVIQVVITHLVNILVQTYQAVCLTLVYFDLRIRKEGFDLELAAQQQAPTPT